MFEALISIISEVGAFLSGIATVVAMLQALFKRKKTSALDFKKIFSRILPLKKPFSGYQLVIN